MRPGVLEDLGLVERDQRPDERILRAEVASHATRSAPAAHPGRELTNIARHAHATHVALRLTAEEDGVVLEVSDDGRGLDGAREGAGIRGMRERALLVGGNLTVQTGPAGGAVVRLEVPAEARRDS